VKKQDLALALMLISGNTLLADPLMSSLQIGPQAPDPISPRSILKNINLMLGSAVSDHRHAGGSAA
jgi:hypothetical protein